MYNNLGECALVQTMSSDLVRIPLVPGEPLFDQARSIV